MNIETKYDVGDVLRRPAQNITDNLIAPDLRGRVTRVETWYVFTADETGKESWVLEDQAVLITKSCKHIEYAYNYDSHFNAYYRERNGYCPLCGEKL